MSDDCACLYGGADDYQPDFYSSRWVRAREEQRCCECLRLIFPGERHHVFTGKWEGEVNTYRTCAACADIQGSLYCDGTWTFTTLWDEIEEQLFSNGGVTGGCLAKLATVEGKRYLSERWWAWVNAQAEELPRWVNPLALRKLPSGVGRARAGVGGGGLW